MENINEEDKIVTIHESGFAVIDVKRACQLCNMSNEFVSSINGNKLSSVQCNRTLRYAYGLLLAYFPFDKKQLAVYNKLSQKERMGFLSRYVVKLANRLNIPKSFIEEYKKSKDRFSFKRKYALDYHKNILIENEKLNGIDKIPNLMNSSEKYIESTSSGFYLESITKSLINSVIEIHINNNKQIGRK